MNNQPAYSRKQWIRAVNFSALLTWAIITIPMTIATNPLIILYTAIFGLPISFLCCWVVGAPILRCVMRHPISWIKAMCWGAIIAAIMAGVVIIITRYDAWQKSLNSRTDGIVRSGEYITEVNGSLTTYGWFLVAQPTAAFIGLGAFVALLVWCIVGEPSSVSDKD